MLTKEATTQNPNAPWVIGASYLIRTVTNYWTGRLVSVYPLELVLADAAWIADTGRWAQAISTGALSEVEAMPADHQVIVARGALVDACQWSHPLPRETR